VSGGVTPDLRASTFLGNDVFYEIVLDGLLKGAAWPPSRPCSIAMMPPRSARM
jgi:hypothetical protein